MIDIQSLNGLADKLTSAIPDSVKTLKGDIDSNIRATLESGLQQMNLVSREEFDVQTALLERTQLKLQQLEEQLAELEKRT
jgi:ubiquinone biosynthesis accessory factor UbiK